MIIYHNNLPCVIDINLFKFTFTVVFNYLGVDEVYIFYYTIIGYLWTRKIVPGFGLGLEHLSSALASASKVCPRLTSLA